MLKRKGLPTYVAMEFEDGLTEMSTPHAGVTLVIELGRVSGVMATAERCLPDNVRARYKKWLSRTLWGKRVGYPHCGAHAPG